MAMEIIFIIIWLINNYRCVYIYSYLHTYLNVNEFYPTALTNITRTRNSGLGLHYKRAKIFIVNS